MGVVGRFLSGSTLTFQQMSGPYFPDIWEGRSDVASQRFWPMDTHYSSVQTDDMEGTRPHFWMRLVSRQRMGILHCGHAFLFGGFFIGGVFLAEERTTCCRSSFPMKKIRGSVLRFQLFC
jgi:hypothetical protein